LVITASGQRFSAARRSTAPLTPLVDALSHNLKVSARGELSQVTELRLGRLVVEGTDSGMNGDPLNHGWPPQTRQKGPAELPEQVQEMEWTLELAHKNGDSFRERKPQ
jgi:hypothetical protein